nr:unnamed protein product [Digitaria exilis]
MAAAGDPDVPIRRQGVRRRPPRAGRVQRPLSRASSSSPYPTTTGSCGGRAVVATVENAAGKEFSYPAVNPSSPPATVSSTSPTPTTGRDRSSR